MIHFFLGRVQGGKAPPARPGDTVREDALLVSLDHLGREIGIGDRIRGITIVVFHFHHGTGHGLAVQQHAPLEDIAAVIGKRSGQRNDLRLQPQRDIPSFFLAEGRHYGLGIVDDEAVFRRLKIRGRLHGELVHAGPLDAIPRPPGLMPDDGNRLERGCKIFRLAVHRDGQGLGTLHVHALHLHGMRERNIQRQGCVLFFHHRRGGRDDHAKMGLSLTSEADEQGKCRARCLPHAAFSLEFVYWGRIPGLLLSRCPRVTRFSKK